MPTRADLDALITSSRDVVGLAQSEVEALWATLDTSDPVEVREALEDVMPGLVASYGDVAAAVSADWYDEMRDRSGAPGAFTALLASPFAAEAVRANARYAIGPLFSTNPDPEAALSRLTLETDRMVLQPGRDTRTLSARNDPAKPTWARVPTGLDPCAFCRMLASQGATYWTEEAAGGLNPDAYHADCGCEPVQLFQGDSMPEGYEPDRLYSEYEDARRMAGSSDPKRVLSAWRQMSGIH